jgi:hypothetical protein
MRVETPAEQLFFTTAYVEGRGNSKSWKGTSFVYAVETNKGTAHFLATNKHVLQEATELKVRMIAGDSNGGPALGQAAEIVVNGFSPDVWEGHPDPKVDVALLPSWQVFNRMNEIGKPPFFKSISPDLCLTQEQAEDLDAMEVVTFIGYPSGIFDTQNLLPIARRGMTATPISVDYRGSSSFLIDGAVFPGSSGSPVFLVDNGSYNPRGGGLVVGSRLICLGVLAAVHVRQVQGDVTSLPTRLIAEFREPIGLGIVFKASTLDECVEGLLSKYGLARSDGGQVTQPAMLTEADEALSE